MVIHVKDIGNTKNYIMNLNFLSIKKERIFINRIIEQARKLLSRMENDCLNALLGYL